MRRLFYALLAVAIAAPLNAAIVERHLDPEFAHRVLDGVRVRNESGASIAANSVVYVCGWDETYAPAPERAWEICKADADVGGAFAQFVLNQTMANNTTCINCAVKQVTLYNQNTSGLTVGDLYYLSTTAGAITSTAPTTANSIVQPVGRVRTVNASTGVIEIDLEHFGIKKIGSNEIQSGAVGSGGLGKTIRAATNLASGDLVYLDSYNATDGVFTAAIADADVANAQAVYVATGTIASGATGTVYKEASVSMNTTGATAGDPVYLTITGTTTNTLSLSAPTGVDDFVQIVGRVQTVAAGGTVLIDLLDFPPGVARNEIQADAINGTKIADDSIDSEHYVDGSIDTAFIADNQVTLAKIVDFGGQGYILRGGAAGAPEESDFSGDGYIGVGDGTDFASVDVTGDVELANTGATTIQANAVETAMIADNNVTLAKIVDFTGQGYIIRGGAAGAPEESDFSGAGFIGVGDGTDFASTDFSTAGQIGLGTGSAFASTALSGLLDISAAGKTTLDSRFKQFNFRDPANMLNTALALPTAAAAETLVMSYPAGSLMLYLEEQVGAPTITDLAQTVTAYGVDFGMDNTDNDGVQLSPQIATGGESFTGQTDAFYAKIQFRVEDASGTDPLCLCVVTPQAYGDIDAVADIANYGGAGEEVACVCTGTGAGTDPAVVHQVSAVNGGGIQNNAFTTSDHQCADGTTYTWEIDIAASGAFTVKVDGNNPGGGGAALTLSADEFFPLIVHDSSSDVNDNFYLSLFEWGLQ